MKEKLLTTLILCSLLATASAQDTAAVVTYSGYVEAFAAFDVNAAEDRSRPTFLYSFNRHGEVNLNLAYLKAAYTAPKTRANVALGTGTYMADNYANEPLLSRFIVEANAGIKLGDNTWLDVGVLPSHIGFESAVGADCPTLTRSLLAENSPYFEAGARLTHTPNSRWTLSVLVLNGWQRIARINGAPALGTQALWKPNDRWTFNWSTFVGSDRPSGAEALRVFNNLYAIGQVSPKLALTLGLDVGVENSNLWYAPVAVARYSFKKHWAAAVRGELYADPDGVIVGGISRLSGVSVNLDRTLEHNALWRIEARWLHHPQPIFDSRNGLTPDDLFVTSSVAVKF